MGIETALPPAHARGLVVEGEDEGPERWGLRPLSPIPLFEVLDDEAKTKAPNDGD